VARDYSEKYTIRVERSTSPVSDHEERQRVEKLNQTTC
jgi:hypothetical protein